LTINDLDKKMKRLKYILQKEFIQTFRDPAILRIIFMMPIIQLIILPLAADYEIKNVNIAVVDNDHSQLSRRLIGKLEASRYFNLTAYAPTYTEGVKAIESDKADLILVIPNQFDYQLTREGNATLQVAGNAVNGVKAGLGSAYLGNIIRDFNGDIRLERTEVPRMASSPSLDIRPNNWYNVHNNYRIFMVPGILGVLLVMVGSFLSALNIVREKEIGTIEQLNVTPMAKWEFIVGKLIPFWVLGLAVLCIGMGVGYVIFGVFPLAGWQGYLTLLGFAAIFMLAALGFGLLISTLVDTQQQAMFMAFFFMMIFILLGGLYTSIDSMPEWAKWIARFNPVSYFIEVIRMIVLKGSSFADFVPQTLAVVGFAVVFNGLAIVNYRKTV
jgi:ABC-2 type transport system permease protein